MKVRIELTEEDVKRLVRNEILDRLGDIPLEASEVKIETKSTQNYKAEWEAAAFRAVVEVTR